MAKITSSEIEFDQMVRIGHEQACDELDRCHRHALDKGNPNHPDYDLHLFGEPVNKFLSRQYK